ncbi:MAG: hypothetical protein ACKO1X_07175 [Acidimicrobiales bacterium]
MHTITTGVLHPWNLSADAKGSIHDDDTANDLGFRAGTVAGDIHLEQFGGILVDAFGPSWFEQGSLSLYFLTPTAHREPVEAFLDLPAAPPLSHTQVTARMATPEGVPVADGTASVGRVSEPSALSSRDRRAVDPTTLRMLRGAHPGRALDVQVRRPWSENQLRRIANQSMTAPLPWYSGESPWGGPVCSPLTMCQLLVAGVTRSIEQECGEFVGMYGAIEVRHTDGPLFLDTEYEITGEVLAVSESPKTEVLWYRTVARAAGSSTVSAEVTMMTRLLKDSSPLYR